MPIEKFLMPDTTDGALDVLQQYGSDALILAGGTMVMPLINEAALCLQENILRNARDGDVGGVFGIGFPPVLGGPFHFADVEGLKKVVKTLRKLEEKFGDRFKPADLLVDMSEKGKTFFPGR